jgi:hypothetical protein
MNKTILSLVVLSAAIAGNASELLAADAKLEEIRPTHDGRIITIRRVPSNESLAQLGARLYDKVDYELRLRELNTEIKLTEARLKAERERTQFYDKNFGRTPALLLTRQNAHLAELGSELQLKDLRKEKRLLVGHRQDQVRFRRLAIERGDIKVKVNE